MHSDMPRCDFLYICLGACSVFKICSLVEFFSSHFGKFFAVIYSKYASDSLSSSALSRNNPISYTPLTFFHWFFNISVILVFSYTWWFSINYQTLHIKNCRDTEVVWMIPSSREDLPLTFNRWLGESMNTPVCLHAVM